MTQLKTVLEIEGYKIEFALSKAVLLQIMILNYLIIINEEATKLGLTVFSQRANLEGGGRISRVSRSISKVQCLT